MACGLGTADVPEFKAETHAKRLLYVRTVTRLLKGTHMKHQNVLATPEGVKGFNTAVAELMTCIETATQNEADIEREAVLIGLTSEIIISLPSQSDQAGKMLIDALITWQVTCSPHDVTLSAILIALNTGGAKGSSYNTCVLMESTLFAYLRQTDSAAEALKVPNWINVLQRTALFAPDLQSLIQNNLLLCVHLYLVLRLKGVSDHGEKLMFLQSVAIYLLDKFKTTEKTEAKWFLIMGLFIQIGLQEPTSGAPFLLSIARSMMAQAVQTEGWGDGLLGAIGLKKDQTTNSKRILLRCLACFVFSAFDESLMDYKRVKAEQKAAMDELKQTIAAKKFADVRQPALEVMGVLQSEEALEGEVKPNVARLIRLFYKEQFLESVEDVWQ